MRVRCAFTPYLADGVDLHLRRGRPSLGAPLLLAVPLHLLLHLAGDPHRVLGPHVDSFLHVGATLPVPIARPLVKCLLRKHI